MNRCCTRISFLLSLVCCIVLCASPAAAQGVLQRVTEEFYTQTSSWAGTLTGYATWLFWTLGTISLVWTGGQHILRKADIGEFFAEFVRFIIFFGFFLWLLRNAAAIGGAIIDSFMDMGANASQTGVSNPSAVMDIGFDIFHKVMEQTSIWNPTDSLIGAILAGIVLICLALIAANMTILLCAGWILLYGGIFFLGFGGSRWTSDIAINYYKSILGVAASLMAMVLMVGIAQNIVTDYYNRMGAGIQVSEIATIMVVSVILLLLVHRIPGLITGILTGASIGHSGIATFGSGAAFGAMGVATAAAVAGGSMAMAGARNIMGTGQMVGAAYQSAQQNLIGNESANSNFESSPVSRLSSAMGASADFVGHMGKSIAKGIGETFKESANATMSEVKKTFPGKVASHIQEETAQTKMPNSMNKESAAVSEKDEIDAFVNSK